MLFFYGATPTDVTLVANVFSGTITLGTAVIAIMLLGFAGYFATKNKALESSQDQANHWRDDYLAERASHQDAQTRFEKLLAESETRYMEQRELKHAALSENAQLKLATDLTQVMKAISDINARLVATEERMTLRFEALTKTQDAQTKVLDAIATRLNGHNQLRST